MIHPDKVNPMSQASNQARLREALSAGSPSSSKDKGPAPVDGVLSADTPESSKWRSRLSQDDSLSSTSAYEPEDDCRPADLYGKFTWKIANFSDVKKRELRSKAFTVGSYKWYILVYPHGCDVCNHLSLFLCVADYDKLLPGWSHFAQFTIAVVNSDPKKSKYSDTLHRFTKKEHDWGWKRFMELSKVYDGFTSTDDTLVIKAQVQVVRDRPSAPFRCLDPQYRRELVRVYLSNVEGICRRFVEERRDQLQVLAEQLPVFGAFWAGLSAAQQEELTTERSDLVLKGIVKRFFNEKEVTSTLVMDALFSGCRQTEVGITTSLAGLERQQPVTVDAAGQTFSLQGDVLSLLQTAAAEELPSALPDKVEPLGRAEAEAEAASDSMQRDERRLAELGRRAVEMYVMSHIFLEKIAAAFSEAESFRRQEALIREEEEREAQSGARAALKAALDRERKARKRERRKAKQEAEHAKQEADAAQAAAAEAAQIAEAACRRQAVLAAEADEHGAAAAAAVAAAKMAGSEGGQPHMNGRVAVASPVASVQSADGINSAGDSNCSPPPDASQALVDSVSAATSSRCRIVDDADDSASTSSGSVQQPPPHLTSAAAAQVTKLRERVAMLEAQLRDRDETVAGLRAELAAATGAPPAPCTPPPSGAPRRGSALAAAAATEAAMPALVSALRGGGPQRPLEQCNGFGGGGSSGGSSSRGSTGSVRVAGCEFGSSSVGSGSSVGRSPGGSPASSQPSSATGSRASSLDAAGDPELGAHLRSGASQLLPISRASTGDLRQHSAPSSGGGSLQHAERTGSASWDRPAMQRPGGRRAPSRHGSAGRAQQGQPRAVPAKRAGSAGSPAAARASRPALNGHASAVMPKALPGAAAAAAAAGAAAVSIAPANGTPHSKSAPTSYLSAVACTPQTDARAAAQSPPQVAAAQRTGPPHGAAAANGVHSAGADDVSFRPLAKAATALAAAKPGQGSAAGTAAVSRAASSETGPSSPPAAKGVRPALPHDSPGLDDFAHMGLITELLE